MKKDHSKIEQLIRQAIMTCGEDSAFSDTKSYLVAALRTTAKVIEKRNRNVTNQNNEIKARETQKKWWDMIKTNAAKNFNLENPPNPDII